MRLVVYYRFQTTKGSFGRASSLQVYMGEGRYESLEYYADLVIVCIDLVVVKFLLLLMQG